MKKKEVTNADIVKAINIAVKGLATKQDLEDKIDGLAIATAKHFDRLDNRLNRHEGIFHTMNRRIEGVEEDVRSVKNSLSLVLSGRD